MRLIRCNIENFGKLSKFSLDFKESTILEKNGFGKTTLSNFIKAMFFGFEADNIKTRKDENNDRKKYYPWQAGAFGGNLTFEIKDKTYKIERFFGENKAKDTFELYNLDTNSKSEDYSSEIGYEIFGIDGHSFERCLYIPQKNIEVGNTESLSNKLNSMIENTDFGVGYDIAKMNLTKVRQAYFVKGGGGLINDTNQKLILTLNTVEEIKQNTKLIELKTQDVKQKEYELASQKLELDETLKQISECGDSSNQKAIIEMFNSIKEEFIKIEKQRDFVKDFFKEETPTNDKIVEIEDLVDNLEIKNRECDNLNNLLKNEEGKPKKSLDKNKTYLFLLPFVILLLTGAIVTLFNSTIGWIICSIGFLGIAGVFIYVLIRYLTKDKDNKSKAFEFHNLTLNLQNTIEEIEQDKLKVEAFFKTFELNEGNFRDRLFSLKTMVRKSLEIEELYINKHNQLQEFEKSNKKVLTKKLEDLESDNKHYQHLQAKNKELLDKISLLEKEIAGLNSQITILNQSVENYDYYVNQSVELKNRLEDYKFKYDCVEKALKFLEEAKTNLDTRYLPSLKKSFLSNLKYLEEIDENKVLINEDLELLIEANGQSRKLFYFSEGYKNLFMLCLRFALIDVIYKEETPFIVLDDPFVNLDKDMFEVAKRLVNKFKEKYQIIYLTCHKSREL